MKYIFNKIFNNFDKYFIKLDNMANITVNGKDYQGRNVIIRNNKVIINDVDVTPDSKIINITVNGDIDNINVDCCEKIIVSGNVNSIDTTSGDVECNDVKGSVHTTSGDIECGNIGGDVNTTSGDVKAENISGNVKTLSGDIKYKK